MATTFTPDAFIGNAGELLLDRRFSEAFPEVEVRRIGGTSKWDYEFYDRGELVGRVELKTRQGFGKLPASMDTIRNAPPWLAKGYQLSRTRKSQYLIDSAKEVDTYLAVLLSDDFTVLITLVDPTAWKALTPRKGGRFDRGRRTDVEMVIDIPWESFQTL